MLAHKQEMKMLTGINTHKHQNKHQIYTEMNDVPQWLKNVHCA